MLLRLGLRWVRRKRVRFCVVICEETVGRCSPVVSTRSDRVQEGLGRCRRGEEELGGWGELVPSVSGESEVRRLSYRFLRLGSLFSGEVEASSILTTARETFQAAGSR